MRKYISILVVAVVFGGCHSGQKELATQAFIESVFSLKQQSNHSWKVDLNEGLSEENQYFYFMHENRLALSYLSWNLIYAKLADSIKYSTKCSNEVQKGFQSLVSQDLEIQRAIQLLIYPKKFKHQNQINIDSLVNLSSKLFYASSAGEGRVGWSFCAGKSKFPEIYGESKSYESVILQALCFQAIFENKYTNNEKSIWDSFDQSIEEVSSEMNSIEYDDYIDKANHLMWEKMFKSRGLRKLLVEFTRQENSKLYFKTIYN